DSDHLGAVKRILDHYTVKRILRTGLERVDSNTWLRADSSVKAADALVINLKHDEFPMGSTYRFGETYITMISGFYAPPDDWDIEGGARRIGVQERRQYCNASIF
ncbi:MAG: hypothetical protein GWN00_16765, partial [Aliifodinibius sp.]|nr:hypothetical protein [candidate division Zixibacteria bacterium]NIT57812.1 hypothetical protein [Fodinibius sp.]NIW45735.1 hypothetical protein [Gammaproteobacteria bacterium]NIS46513.1 hypothetical protein [candidate division Zixibacteria bacterium]NIV06830.1 hypothetical protein [candidate division Zixibacteria bacterium]